VDSHLTPSFLKYMNNGNMTNRGSRVDIESLERDNDRSLDALSERVGLLKQAREPRELATRPHSSHTPCMLQATLSIKGEVDSQHSLLDGIDSGMFGARGLIGSVNDKFKMVLNDKQGSKTMMVIIGSVIVLFGFWYFVVRR
jgi:hypothetical protein